MNKNKIIALSMYTKEKIKIFSGSGKTAAGDFLNWDIHDVIGHIAFWLNYSKTQLINMKTKKQFDHIENLEDTNFNAYTMYKGKPLEEVIKETEDLFTEYLRLADPFTEEELEQKDYFPGVSLELWKCMVLDLFIHPIMHILHYYLKEGMYREFTEEIKTSGKDFLDYSGNRMDVFSFKEFYGDQSEKISRFTKLQDFSGERDNELLRGVIQFNIEEN
ncbi:hypothetical protein [Breznakiella homolactica]|uniref:Mycothiol-dependent maleylpyruvate isomerase metal-binding domain-containing protein n=1 Tax=Breznakiella homolactica TaxID=2798577 RepID=A0A7T8BA10_9SPIR|nr:hypothetical protein [Breznakiella homolactica]QQO07743.1 hypothetical protein JFL75_12400 [Breznakiella homolactica]